MMNMKVAILLALALCAVATSTLSAVNLSMPELSDVSRSLTGTVKSPVQPLGDPVDNDGDVPHN